VRRAVLIVVAASLLLACAAWGQISGDVIGQHALGPGSTSPVKGTLAGSCQYCHAPHSGLDNALWNQKLSTQTYTPYSSTTYAEKGNVMVPAQTDTNLCLSCHDGTVAAGTSIVYGQIASGKLLSTDTVATLQSSHPVSLILPLVDAPDLVSTLYANGTTGDPTNVKLVNGNVECTTCHNPHVEGKDLAAKNFLVKESSAGALCLSCHDPDRVMNGVTSGLNGWSQSIHATSTAAVQNLPYGTLALNGCLNCHTDHNAAGAEWLQRGAGDQVCLNCHSSTNNANKSAAGVRPSKLAPQLLGSTSALARLNIASEYEKIGHPMSNGIKPVEARMQEKNSPQPQLITSNQPNLSGCIDCHNPHAVQSTNTFTQAPAVRASQTRVSGVSEKDGVTLLKPASGEYETCLRCHGPSSVKTPNAKYGYEPARTTAGGLPLNLVPQFNLTARSAHPVARNRMSGFPQPSLRAHMLQLNGGTQGRVMGDRIFCTDCHNSDDNREFGGTGPAGPHGSRWSHILERRYEFSQTLLPGGLITQLYPTPDLGPNGPYALCAKCHDLTKLSQGTSFKKHTSHINEGFSCTTCHTAHGMQANSVNSSGERLVNFDINVVAPNAGQPISYNRGASTCTLTCHAAAHNPDGTVTVGGGKGGKKSLGISAR
jgi:predicted CXXCH cytochrome family protein